jgi:outer membrane translocation and assembly module TamA
MSNDLTNRTRGTGLGSTSERTSVLNELAKTLTPEQKEQLAMKATEALMEAESNERAAKLRYDASTVEMARHVDVAKEHEKLKSDFTINSSFKTASGETNIKVTKSNNLTIIVIAVVIAVIFFVMFSK